MEFAWMSPEVMSPNHSVSPPWHAQNSGTVQSELPSWFRQARKLLSSLVKVLRLAVLTYLLIAQFPWFACHRLPGRIFWHAFIRCNGISPLAIIGNVSVSRLIRKDKGAFFEAPLLFVTRNTRGWLWALDPHLIFSKHCSMQLPPDPTAWPMLKDDGSCGLKMAHE